MSQASCFDAVIEWEDHERELPVQVLICVNERAVPVSVQSIGEKPGAGRAVAFFRVRPALPLALKWKQIFTVKCPKSGEVLGKGKVLDPVSGKFSPREKKQRNQYLMNLLGDEKQMLWAVVQHKGISGIHEKELMRFCPLSRAHLLDLSQELESGALIRILEFSPLFIISQAAISFICDRILKFLSQFHAKHPGDLGAEKETIRNRFGLHPRVLTLVLKYLTQKGQIKMAGDLVALNSFKMTLLPEEEKILDRMEELYLKDKFQSFSMDELKKAFRLSSKQLNKMLALLIEKKKIVLGSDGFILHYHWLEEIIRKIRVSGEKELTVAEFKEMTGLSRKYAIPLLELLDQMGVTRRRGSSREIL